jgi:hypothetical protein
MNRNQFSEPVSHCIKAEKASRTHHRSPGSDRIAGWIVRGVHAKPSIVGSATSPASPLKSAPSLEATDRG